MYRRLAAIVVVAVAIPIRAAQGQIVQAAWLSGCWEARNGFRVIEEQWMAPRGRTMLNMARTVRGDTLVDYEQVVLREQNGKLEYESHPFNQPMAVFTSTQMAPGRLVFENPLHDYPQRIGYTQRGADSLIAWIDGTVGGKSKRVEFPYARVRCGS